jgi:hypothetical protein
MKGILGFWGDLVATKGPKEQFSTLAVLAQRFSIAQMVPNSTFEGFGLPNESERSVYGVQINHSSATCSNIFDVN